MNAPNVRSENTHCMGIVCCMAGNQLDWLGFNCYSNNKFLFGRLQTCKTGDLMYSNTPPLQWVSSDQVGYPFAWSSPSPPISHISPCLLWVMVIISSRGRHNGWGGVGNYPLHKSTISGPTPASFLFRSYQTQYYRKTVGFSRIRTRIVGVEGKHTDAWPPPRPNKSIR